MTKKKEIKKETLKEEKKSSKKKHQKKESIISRIGNFFAGVKTEFKRVKWPSKKEMIKYSAATIIFVIVCSLFFYLIDVIIAALHAIGS